VREGWIPFYRSSSKTSHYVDITGHVWPKAGDVRIPTVTRLVGHVWRETRNSLLESGQGIEQVRCSGLSGRDSGGLDMSGHEAGHIWFCLLKSDGKGRTCTEFERILGDQTCLAQRSNISRFAYWSLIK
jgi:hypothetical protein